MVAADRYRLERLRLMCEKILSESLDVATVMATLLLVRCRPSCRQLEESCIQYIASHPDPGVYAAVKRTEEYEKLKENCSSLIIEITDRAAMHSLDRRSSPDKSCSTSASMYNVSEVVRGVHEIPNFKAVHKSHACHDWRISLYPSGNAAVEGDKYISVYLQLVSDLPAGTAAVVKTSICFKIQDPSGTSPLKVCSSSHNRTSKSRTWGYEKFISLEAAKSKYMAHDGSLTNGSDVGFLVEESEIRAHRLVIAARSPALHGAVAGTKEEEDDHSTVMKAAVFKAVLHFIYTDELLPGDGTRLLAGDMHAHGSVPLARRHRCKGLEDYCIDFISTPDVAKELLKAFIALDN
ncbi:Speckle-type POZ protein-like protein [Hordeum vulgare]|nr:Speckle-type POZ protein-like protein [Hordeum vulgare]